MKRKEADSEREKEAYASTTKASIKRRRTLSSRVRDEFSVSAVKTAIDRSIQAADAADNCSCRVIYLNKSKTSWICHARRWFRYMFKATMTTQYGSYRAWLDTIWALHPPQQDTIKLFGKEVLAPRFMQVYGIDYKFSNKVFVAKPVPEAFNGAVQHLQQLVKSSASGNTMLNMCLVNWYEHGGHFMGAHSDDEQVMHEQSPVVTLSLGAARRFVFTPKKHAVDAERLELMLEDGDLLVMGGLTQRTHKHALPKMKKCIHRRISLTMRCFVEN